MYLGDLAHSSYRPNETQINAVSVPQLQQLWNISVGATISTAVTVSHGFLYFGDWAGNLHAVDALTGAFAWTQFLGVSPPAQQGCSPGPVGIAAQPVVSGTTVYAAGGDAAVYAMDSATGQIQWRVALGDPSTGSFLWSSPMVYQNAIYIGIASLNDCPLIQGGMARIPLDNPGKPRIVYFTTPDTPGASLWSTPAIDAQNNMIYVTTGNSTNNIQDAGAGVYGSAMLALDATTLQIQSYFFMPLKPEEDDNDWGSSPSLFEAGGQPLVAASGKNGVMYVLHRPDLALVWSYQLAVDCDSPTVGCGSISTPAFNGSALITGAGQPPGDAAPPGAVYAFDPAGQQILWMYAARAAVLAPVTLTPGLVFVASEQGLSALDATTGLELWNDGETTGLYSQPVVSNGVLYATYVDGSVVAWAPANNGGAPTMAVSPAGLKFSCTVSGIAPAAQSITVVASAPGVAFTVASDSSWLTAGIQSGSTPATVSVQASPFIAPGNYTGNLILTAGGNTVSLPVALVVNPSPAVTSAGAVNSASYQSDLAPGSLFTIFGSLSGETASLAAPWPNGRDGITVSFDSVAAPLGYVSPTQINAQVPFETAPGAHQVTVTSNGVVYAPFDVTIQPAAPGIFTDTAGHAAVLNQDYSPNQPANPAPAGSYISVYLTGQGAVDQKVATGSAAPSNATIYTVAQTTATIGGSPATVSFSGLAPGYVGLTQVNLLVPSLPSGDYPLAIVIGGWQSNSAIVSIAAAQ
jgi:uncharacterized protein (TIGR03437 family)